MAIFNTGGGLIGVVETATSKPDVPQIKHKLTNGAWVVQQIGAAHTVLDVSAYLTKSQKSLFDSVRRVGGEVEVIFDGRFYKGHIDEEAKPEYERLPSSTDPIFKIAFVLLVREEGDV